jgi:hypothetical protein
MMSGIPVRIGVVFEPNKRAKPVWFELNRQKFVVKETTYHWRDRVGDTLLLHYAVTTDGALYELIFNCTDQSWSLYKQDTE